MPSVRMSLNSYNVGWLRKLYYRKEENLHWIHLLKISLKEYNPRLKIECLFTRGIEQLVSSKLFRNNFWTSVIKSVKKLLKCKNMLISNGMKILYQSK